MWFAESAVVVGPRGLTVVTPMRVNEIAAVGSLEGRDRGIADACRRHQNHHTHENQNNQPNSAKNTLLPSWACAAPTAIADLDVLGPLRLCGYLLQCPECNVPLVPCRVCENPTPPSLHCTRCGVKQQSSNSPIAERPGGDEESPLLLSRDQVLQVQMRACHEYDDPWDECRDQIKTACTAPWVLRLGSYLRAKLGWYDKAVFQLDIVRRQTRKFGIGVHKRKRAVDVDEKAEGEVRNAVNTPVGGGGGKSMVLPKPPVTAIEDAMDVDEPAANDKPNLRPQEQHQQNQEQQQQKQQQQQQQEKDQPEQQGQQTDVPAKRKRSRRGKRPKEGITEPTSVADNLDPSLQPMAKTPKELVLNPAAGWKTRKRITLIPQRVVRNLKTATASPVAETVPLKGATAAAASAASAAGAAGAAGPTGKGADTVPQPNVCAPAAAGPSTKTGKRPVDDAEVPAVEQSSRKGKEPVRQSVVEAGPSRKGKEPMRDEGRPAAADRASSKGKEPLRQSTVSDGPSRNEKEKSSDKVRPTTANRDSGVGKQALRQPVVNDSSAGKKGKERVTDHGPTSAVGQGSSKVKANVSSKNNAPAVQTTSGPSRNPSPVDNVNAAGPSRKTKGHSAAAPSKESVSKKQALPQKAVSRAHGHDRPIKKRRQKVSMQHLIRLDPFGPPSSQRPSAPIADHHAEILEDLLADQRIACRTIRDRKITGLEPAPFSKLTLSDLDNLDLPDFARPFVDWLNAHGRALLDRRYNLPFGEGGGGVGAKEVLRIPFVIALWSGSMWAKQVVEDGWRIGDAVRVGAGDDGPDGDACRRVWMVWCSVCSKIGEF